MWVKLEFKLRRPAKMDMVQIPNYGIGTKQSGVCQRILMHET